MEDLVEVVSVLQKNNPRVRNVTIIAHVDHGKTSLSDSLLASNGIISPKQAGEVRFLDSRPDEQLRGITMKASSICLLYKHEPTDIDKITHESVTKASPLITTSSAHELGTKLALHKTSPNSASSIEQISFATESKALWFRSSFPVRDSGPYLVNLIDSPGHIDFSTEVSAALRLSDGAMVVVDVVEGVCVQTHSVLKQAWDENVKVCLVLNKMDRLITELKVSPHEAYLIVKKVVEQVNVILNTCATADRMEHSLPTDESNDIQLSPAIGNVIFCSAVHGWGFSTKQFAEMYSKKLGMKAEVMSQFMWGDYFFNPTTKSIVKKDPTGKLKVTFVQFVLDNIWKLYDAVMNQNDFDKVTKMLTALEVKVQPRELKLKDRTQTIQIIMSKWLPVHKAIMSMVVDHLPSPAEAQPVRFPQLLSALTTTKPEKEEKDDETEDKTQDEQEGSSNVQQADISTEQSELIAKSLECSNSASSMVGYIAKSFTVAKTSIVTRTAQPARTRPEPSSTPRQRQAIATPREAIDDDEFVTRRSRAKKEKESTEILDIPIETQAPKEITPVSRPMAETTAIVSPEPTTSTTATETEVVMCLTRVFGGTLSVGQEIHVFGPKYHPSKPNDYHSIVTANDIYLMMGRELIPVQSVPAGNVCCLGGLDKIVMKTATVSSVASCPPLSRSAFQPAPILRVAIEPENPMDLEKLISALRYLHATDTALEVVHQANGEHILLVQGTIHLQRCITDINELTSNIRLRVSPPIVPFREGLVPFDTPNMAPPVIFASIAGDETEEQGKKNKKWPSPPIYPLIVRQESDEAEAEPVGKTLAEKPFDIPFSTPNGRLRFIVRACPLPPTITRFLVQNQDRIKAWGQNAQQSNVIDELKEEFVKVGGDWEMIRHNILAVGPKRCGPNVLINGIPHISPEDPLASGWPTFPSRSTTIHEGLINEIFGSIVSGFDMACNSGPLCEEPMIGVCFVIASIVESPYDATALTRFGPISGQVMSTMKESCRSAFTKQAQRLVEAMYICDLVVAAEVLGKLYAVVNKRRGRILKEDVIEGTEMFLVKALLPVVETLDFGEELRKKTSGNVTPQLVFSHWEVLNIDPFWQPRTEDEIESFGEDAASLPNTSRQLINLVRKRKGLFVEEKIVAHGEKQRTLQRKK